MTYAIYRGKPKSPEYTCITAYSLDRSQTDTFPNIDAFSLILQFCNRQRESPVW